VNLSLSVTDLVKIAREYGLESHEDTADWLDQVAKEAKELASIWSEMVRQLQRDGPDRGAGVHRAWDFLKPHIMNGLVYRQLYEFYGNATTILSGTRRAAKRNANLQEQLFNGLGSLLKAREASVEAYTRAFKQTESAFLISGDSQPRDLSSLETAVDVLQKEAAALAVLAVNYRAGGARAFRRVRSASS
jgi:hypothetical protein